MILRDKGKAFGVEFLPTETKGVVLSDYLLIQVFEHELLEVIELEKKI